MIQINLLPWREKYRQTQKSHFIYLLTGSVILALFVLLIIHLHLSSLVDTQNQLNAYLQTELNNEQKIVSASSEQEAKKNYLENELNFIINIYKKNYAAISLFNELLTLVPNSITLNKIARTGDKITLAGIAQTDDDVTSFINHLEKLGIFNQPTLSEITSEKGSERRSFSMDVTQKGD